MKRIIYLMMGVSLLCCGCRAKEPEVNITTAKSTESTESAAETTQQMEERVLAMAGNPNEDGYYSIDLPRSAADLMPLEQINSRLYWTSAVMADEQIEDFDGVPEKLLWKSLNMEAAFNYGSSSPFNESDDATFTSILPSAFYDFANQSFKINEDISKMKMGEGFRIADGMVQITYKEPTSKAFGFVMSEYKQEGNLWYIKGEIMSLADTVYAKGEFVLESNGSNAVVPYKILSFTEE